ncbi:MAG: hypothetical protein AAFR59_00145 [Bacteroidota bacterium]
MQALLSIILLLVIISLLLYIRYLRVRAGLGDNAGGGVQRMPQRAPSRPLNEAFLPGSRSTGKKKEEKEEKPKSGDIKRKKARPFTSKADIKRSYIIDALLERPKF